MDRVIARYANRQLQRNHVTKKYLILIIGGDNPHTKAQPLVNQFKLIFEFMNITNYRFLIGEGNKPYDVLNDSQFIKELANINLALKKGDIYD